MTRVFNQQYKIDQVTIFPGEVYVSRKDEIITTILGSCISICLFDKKNGVSGMNHYMLPQNSNSNIEYLNNESNLSALRFGDNANKELINKMVEFGAEVTSIEAKIFGGGSIIPSTKNDQSIGQRNIFCAENFLINNNISIITEDTGSSNGRRISLFTDKHDVLVKEIFREIPEAILC
ncbi:MAG: chemotaxis protein CheD [Spirochaetaceae bacterium]